MRKFLFTGIGLKRSVQFRMMLRDLLRAPGLLELTQGCSQPETSLDTQTVKNYQHAVTFRDNLLPRCFVQWYLWHFWTARNWSATPDFSDWCWISENPGQELLVYAERLREVRVMKQRCTGFAVHVVWDPVKYVMCLLPLGCPRRWG